MVRGIIITSTSTEYFFLVCLTQERERKLNTFVTGGVRSNMYKELPKPLMSEFGFQGCLASLELNGDVVDPEKVLEILKFD